MKKNDNDELDLVCKLTKVMKDIVDMEYKLQMIYKAEEDSQSCQ